MRLPIWRKHLGEAGTEIDDLGQVELGRVFTTFSMRSGTAKVPSGPRVS